MGKSNGKPGPDRIEIAPADLRKIESMAGYGLTNNAIADVLGISHDTFERRRADDPEIQRYLERGKAVAEAKVGQALFNLATGASYAIDELDKDGKTVTRQIYTQLPHLGAIVWYEKTRCRRRDPSFGQDEADRGDEKVIPLATLRAAMKRVEEARKAERDNGKQTAG